LLGLIRAHEVEYSYSHVRAVMAVDGISKNQDAHDIVVAALNVCLERVAHDDLAAAGIRYDSMNHLELLDWLGAPSPPTTKPGGRP
jgi:hypothetical protein